ncbi:sulfotransferase family protein [Roseivivax sp. CAU 1761]
MAVPVFVLGLQRSGTTWIANLIAGSEAVAAVTAEEHRGVHESIFFSHFATAFGPFDDAAARARFRAAFAGSDYFLQTGLPEAVLDRALARARDYAGVFAAVMDALAERHGCAFWLEKSPHHTLLAERLARRFPEARFVCVTRASPGLIASRLSAFGRTPPRGLRRVADILRGALVNALYVRRLRRFAAGCDRALLLRYETFLADDAAGRRMLSDFLGPGIAAETMQSAFAPNSSHRGRRSRRLSPADRGLIALGDGIGRLLPLRFLAAIERRRRRARGIDWPDWVWTKSGFRPA